MTDKKYIIRFLIITACAIVVFSLVYAFLAEHKSLTAEAQIYEKIRDIIYDEDTVVVEEKDLPLGEATEPLQGAYTTLKQLNLEEHKYLDEYIDIIGGKDKLTVDYIRITMMNGTYKQEQFVYDGSAADWVWETFLGAKCSYKGKVSCDCCQEDSIYNDTRKWVDFKVCIRNKDDNSVYYITISMHGTVYVYDGGDTMDTLSYGIEESMFLEACRSLVDNYKGYELKVE